MTRIDFYTHVENRLQIACTLSAKAFQRGMKVRVYTPNEVVSDQFDKLLWTAPAIAFIPHCRVSDPLAADTPIVVDHSSENTLYDEVLINLHMECPPFFSRFQRLVEIVSLEETDRQAGRERFRFYRDRGYEIHTHEIGKKGLD